jgi:hypothetical protein
MSDTPFFLFTPTRPRIESAIITLANDTPFFVLRSTAKRPRGYAPYAPYIADENGKGLWGNLLADLTMLGINLQEI